MKKCIAIVLCVCSLCTLTMTAFASDSEPDYVAEYEALYSKMPLRSDYSSDEEAQAAFDAWSAGFTSYYNMRYAEWSRQKADEEEVAEQDTEAAAPSKPVESVGSNYENYSSVPVSAGSADKYPVGSYVDPAGNVFSPSGTLLSPGTTPAYAPVSGSDEDVSLLSDELADSNDFPAVSDSDTPAMNDRPTWYIDDLRSADPPAEVLTGLKSLVTSIFGEYTPVTTTSIVSETVGVDTHQYLVETVAPGAAGVDYEWIAGVVLFAIMLFCLMKLLGGILK